MVMGKESFIYEGEYREWLQQLILRFRQSQIKAAIKVNRELLRFYWSLGEDIVEKKAESKCIRKSYHP